MPMWHCLTHYDEIARFRVKNLLVNDPEAVLAVMCFPFDLKSAEPRHAATPHTNCPVRRGRQVKCAAGVGGDGGRIGGVRVVRPFGLRKFDIILVLSGIEDHGSAWIETGAVDNPRQGSRESLSFALGR